MHLSISVTCSRVQLAGFHSSLSCVGEAHKNQKNHHCHHHHHHVIIIVITIIIIITVVIISAIIVIIIVIITVVALSKFKFMLCGCGFGLSSPSFFNCAMAGGALPVLKKPAGTMKRPAAKRTSGPSGLYNPDTRPSRSKAAISARVAAAAAAAATCQQQRQPEQRGARRKAACRQ